MKQLINHNSEELIAYNTNTNGNTLHFSAKVRTFLALFIFHTIYKKQKSIVKINKDDRPTKCSTICVAGEDEAHRLLIVAGAGFVSLYLCVGFLVRVCT